MSTVTIKGKCDICNKKDGFRGHNLQQCRRCGVVAHETCTGLVSTKTKNPNWECYACQATEGGTKARPTECVLCSVKDGLHVMHPLYDTDGKTGKHVMLPEDKHGPSRPAWVHTLCAMFIASNAFTKGCVYGCDIDGNYECDTDDESSKDEQDDTVDVDKDASKQSQNDSPELMSTHHFVIAHIDNDGKETPWTKRITASRTLKCIFCRQSDKTDSLRIPVQCCWNSEDELEEFKKRHRPGEEKEKYCCVAMHVGCARWKLDDFGNPPPRNRVYFYPGLEVEKEHDNFMEPICNSFCTRHASLIHDRKPAKKPNIDPLQTLPQTSVSDPTISQKDPPRQPQPTKPSAAKQELRRKEMELQAQNQIREKRRQEQQQQRHLKLTKRMTDDLEKLLLSLMEQGVQKSEIVAARKQRKTFWAKESKLGSRNNTSFHSLWKTVEKNVQNTDSFNKLYELWLKKIEGAGETSSSTDNDETKESESTWRHLWYPSYNGERFKFDKWETFEYIDSLSDFGDKKTNVDGNDKTGNDNDGTITDDANNETDNDDDVSKTDDNASDKRTKNDDNDDDVGDKD